MTSEAEWDLKYCCWETQNIAVGRRKALMWETQNIAVGRRKALLLGDAKHCCWETQSIAKKRRKALRLYDSLSERMRISMVGDIFS